MGRATEQAAAALRRADDRLAHRFEALARVLLRAEGVASSEIEGVRAPAELVAVAQVDPAAVDSTSAWVADNLAVVDAGDLDPVTRAAIVHAQFEAMYPYGDGNGRLGRVLSDGCW